MTRRLKSWLRSYAEYTEISEAPETFNFWSGVSAIAGALRRRVWIEQHAFQWTPNFYIVFVAPPGIATKSTAINVGMKLLKQVDGIVMGPQSLTWQGLTLGLQEARRLVPILSSGEDLLSRSYLTMSAITCAVSELGTMLDTKDGGLVSVLIDMWDGQVGSWERWLKSSDNTKIENPWINIITATTPSWLTTNFTEEMVGGGLTSRMVFVYADKKHRLIPYISNLVDTTERDELEKALVEDLNEIALMMGEFHLTPDATEFGIQWYTQHYLDKEEHLKDPRLSGYAARKQTHFHKLAMILSASESDSRIITKEHLIQALGVMSGVEHDMHIVFRSIGMHQSARYMDSIREIINTYPNMEHQQLWQKCYRLMSLKEFSDAIDSLVRAGYIRILNNAGVINIISTGLEESNPHPHSIQ